MCALAVAAVCLSLPASAADLPKSGKYSGHYGWTFTGHVQQLGADRVVYAGMAPGVMFNNEGKGFMRKARVDCTLYNDVNQGRANAIGTCVVTDADGDNLNTGSVKPINATETGQVVPILLEK